MVLKPGQTATIRETQEYVKGQVAAYKHPRRVWLLEALPQRCDQQDPQARDPAVGGESGMLTRPGVDDPGALLDTLIDGRPAAGRELP